LVRAFDGGGTTSLGGADFPEKNWSHRACQLVLATWPMRRRTLLSPFLKNHAISTVEQMVALFVEYAMHDEGVWERPHGNSKVPKKRRRLVSKAAPRRRFRRSDYLVGTVAMV
jgi:hypothetical protein